jgi:hypothetical protein
MSHRLLQAGSIVPGLAMATFLFKTIVAMQTSF